MALTKISTGMLKADAASVDLNIDAGTLFLDVANNRVGIANTSPSTPLHVIAASPELRLQDSDDNGYLSLNHNGGNSYFSTTQGGILFRTGNTTERMRITSAGNVGIGTSSPGSLLHVYDGNIQLQSPSGSGGRYISLNNTHTGGRDYRLTSTSDSRGSLGGGDFAIFDNDISGNDAAKTRLLIDSSGNVGIGTTSPGRKLSVETAGPSIVSSFKR